MRKKLKDKKEVFFSLKKTFLKVRPVHEKG
jgi:hypothetical protein